MDLLEFTKEEVNEALKGSTKQEGGLNVNDIRRILASNGLESAGLRSDLLPRLKGLINAKAAKARAGSIKSKARGAAAAVSSSIAYYKQELVDVKYNYGTFVKYTAYMNDVDIGYLTGLYHIKDNTLELMFLYVNETYRGRGIASTLLSYALKDASVRKAKNIVVDDESEFGPNMCRLPVEECHKHNIYIKNGFRYLYPNSSSMTYKGKPLVQSDAFTVRADHLRNIPINEQDFVRIG